VSKYILGVPYDATDLNTINIDIEKKNNKIKVIRKEDLVKEELSLINQFRLNLQIDFTETVIRIHYVTFLDVFSELGGLNASVNSILAQFGVLFLMSYFYSLSSMIHRKYCNKIDI